MIRKGKLKKLLKHHVVRTWGNAKETIELLESHMYGEVRHLFGMFYFCTKIGNGLADVAVLV